MEKIKLDIQKFAQTLLNNKKSTASSPYCYYTVECTSISNRTISQVDVTIKVTSHLASSASYFGTGSTYGLTGTIYFNGVTKTISLKSTSASWSGTGNHTASKTFTVDCPAAATSLTGIYFKVDRTGSKAGTSDTSAGCWLAKTACSNITGIAQMATTPVFTVNPSITNLTETTATLNLGTATATGEVYYQYKIDSGNYSGNVTTAQSLTGFSANTSHTYSVKAINKINSSLIAEVSGNFTTYKYPYNTNTVPTSISLDSSTKSFTLNFYNALNKTITITAKIGTTSVLANDKTSLTTSGTSCTVSIDTDKIYSLMASSSTTLNFSATSTGFSYTPSITLNANSSYAGPTLNISKMEWRAKHISPYDNLNTTSMITSHSYLEIRGRSGLATANKSATISSITFNFNNKGAQTITIGDTWAVYKNNSTTYNLTGTQTGTVTITDSRGFTKTGTISISFISYSNPTLTITAARDGYSTNVIFTFSPSYSLAAYGNRLQTAYLDTNSSPTTVRTLTNNKITIQNIALDSSPVYYAKITDIVNGTSSVVSVTVPKAEPILFIDATKLGVGVNCLPDNTGLYSKNSIYSTAGSLYAGTNGDTTAERQVVCRSGAGILYLYSQASTTGSRGLYVPAHGNGGAKSVISIDTNNNATFNGNASTATTASKLGSSNVGDSSGPIYLNGGTPTACYYPASGNWFRGVPYVSSGGVMEVGRYLDFHPTNNSTLDYSKRLDAGTGTTARTLTLPDKTGTLAITSDIDAKFPVGSVYITNTNSNPGSYLPGGTSGWTLIDKEFAPFCVTGSTDGTYFTKNTTYIDTMTLSFTIAGHSIDFSGSFKLKHALDDADDDPFGSFNLSSFVSNFRNDRYVSGWTDGGNCIDMLKVTSAGALTSVDIVGANSVAVGQTVGVTIHFNFQMSDMVDAKCNKFYWKRTA